MSRAVVRVGLVAEILPDALFRNERIVTQNQGVAARRMKRQAQPGMTIGIAFD